MAERRMFAKTIVDSDAFLEMPLSTQALYFHLGMRADDDGFVNAPKKILRMIGVQEDDMKLLITKKFIIPFESGVIVIKHWKIHNTIQNDRYHATPYQKEKEALIVEENRAYKLLNPDCIQDVSRMETEIRLDKTSIDKIKLMPNGANHNKFIPPSLDQVTDYLAEKSITSFTAEEFIDYYSTCGWTVGKQRKPMKDWKAAIRTWQRRHAQEEPQEKAAETNSRGEVLQ